jgi:hypothetical protein
MVCIFFEFVSALAPMSHESKVDSILLVLFLIIKVVILLLVNRKGGYITTILL